MQGQSMAVAQALRYAEEFRELHTAEQTHRKRVEHTLAMLHDSYATTVRALASALELRDDITGGHAERVTKLALCLTERVAPHLLEDPQLEYGFLLHDLGKIGIPDSILLKQGPLNAEERRAIELHPLHGERILAQIPYLNGVAREVVIAHHERWDGSGYPQGLAGAEIPLSARIFGLVDTLDAMTNDRPYRRAVPVSQALDEIERQAGRQFDPQVAAEFVALVAGAGMTTDSERGFQQGRTRDRPGDPLAGVAGCTQAVDVRRLSPHPGQDEGGPREREVPRVVAAGATNRQFDARVGAGDETVKTPFFSTFVKLGAGNRAGVVSRAHGFGLL